LRRLALVIPKAVFVSSFIVFLRKVVQTPDRCIGLLLMPTGQTNPNAQWLTDN